MARHARTTRARSSLLAVLICICSSLSTQVAACYQEEVQEGEAEVKGGEAEERGRRSEEEPGAAG